MTLVAPTALYLLLTGGAILLLYFLRTRSRRQEVSDLFLWDGLPSEPRSRAARIRQRLEPLLLLQLLVLTLVSVALAGPAMRVARPHLAGMAIVLDGSASMRSRARDGTVRYELARQVALDLLRRYPSSPVAVVQFSSAPSVLSSFSEDHADALRAVSTSAPTFLADGTAAQLRVLLESQGGAGRFDRIFWLGDHRLGGAIPNLEETLFPPDENLAVTAFNVRQNPDGSGSTAFVRLVNHGASYREGNAKVSDGVRAAVLPFVLAPGREEAYVLPLPGSLGPVFVASLDTKDGFPDDDVRYFTFPALIERQIRWIGEKNRYLLAALQAAGPVALLAPDDPSAADLVVAYGTTLPAETTGNALLVHSGLAGLVEIGGDAEPAPLVVAAPDDPLLAQVDPSNFWVRASPSVALDEEVRVILALGSQPFLCRYADVRRRIVFVAPDLLETNLPLTVDFPLLVANILRWFSPSSGREATADVLVGEPIALGDYGRAIRLKEPWGEELPLLAGTEAFVPPAPGVYTLSSDRGTFVVAANLDPAESSPPAESSALTSSATAPETRKSALVGLWPYLAALALLALLAEDLLYRGATWRRSR